MKNARALASAVVFALVIGVPPLAAASGDAGFRGIPWGADLSGHPQMRRISCEGASCTYVRSGEDLSMGGAQATSVTYRTVDGRFVEAAVEALAETSGDRGPGPESANFIAFRQACNDLFGPTTFAASFEYLRAEQYRWESTGIRKVLRVNFNKNHLLLSVTDHNLLEQISTEEPPAGPALSRERPGDGAPARNDEKPGAFGRLRGLMRRVLVEGKPTDGGYPDFPGAGGP